MIFKLYLKPGHGGLDVIVGFRYMMKHYKNHVLSWLTINLWYCINGFTYMELLMTFVPSLQQL